MFEGLIKKILSALFGKFIEGIDKNHIQLGVFSGNLVIEGVSIKKEAIDQLELPIQLIHSSIQRIQIVLPWNKLSTQRTEIRIKNVFLLLTTKDKKDWNLKDINSFVKKVKEVELNIKKAIEEEIKNKNLIKEQQSQNDQQEIDMKDMGLFQKIISRIIDNIYVSIQNVHCRYEHNIGKHTFSLGITIHKIEQQTVDDDWKSPRIVDRFDQKNVGNFINKSINLEKLALYWNSDDQLLYYLQPTQYIQQKMQQELVFEPELTNHLQQNQNNQKFRSSKSSKYIFCLNALAKVVQTYYHHYQTPEYKINIELHEMDFKIKHTQYQEIVKLGQIFNEYQYSVKIQRDMFKITAIKPDRENYKNKPLRSFYQNYFIYLVNKIVQENMRRRYIEYYLKALNKKTEPQKLFKGKEFRTQSIQFQQIVLKSSVETLQIWTQTAIDIHNKQLKTPSGISWWQIKDSNNNKQKQEEENLRKEIEKAFKASNQNTIDQESYVYLEFSLVIAKGSLKLMRKHKNLEEGFTIIWQQYEMQLKKRQNNFEMEQVIQNLEVQMFSVEEKNDIIVPIVKKIQSYEFQQKPLVYFKLEKHPLYKPNFFSSIQLEVQKIEIMIFIASMNRIITYFRVPATEDRPPQRLDVNKTTKNVNSLLEQQTKNEIRIAVQSPIVIIPNKQINDLNSDCWVLKLGDLDIFTVDNMESNQNPQKFNFQRVMSKISETPQRAISQQPNVRESIRKSKFFANPLSGSFNYSDQFKSSLNNNVKSKNIYDKYIMKLESVQLQYFSSIHYFYNYQKLSTTPKGLEILNHPLRVKSIKLDILDQFSIQLNLYFIKQWASSLPGKAQTKIDFELPLLKCTLTPLVPHSLQRLSETIQNFSQDQTLSSILQQEKLKLIKYSTYKGYLRKRGTFLRSWSSYYVVLSGWYLYLYQNENDNDFQSYLGLREIQISEAQNDIGVLYSFKLKNLKEICYFQAQSQMELKKWLKFIQQKIHDINSKLNLAQQQKPQQQYQVNQAKLSYGGDRRQSHVFYESSAIQSKLKFNIQKIEIILQYEQAKQKETIIIFDQIKLKSMSKLTDSYQQFSIKSIQIKDENQHILKSIQYSIPQTPQGNKSPGFIKDKKDKMQSKYEKMLKFINQRKFQSKSALNFRIYQVDQPFFQSTSINMLLLLSDIEVSYKASFTKKLTNFIQKPKESQTQPKKEQQNETSQQFNDIQTQNLQTQLIFTGVPASVEKTKIFQEEISQIGKQQQSKQIKSFKSFTLQKSISDNAEQVDQQQQQDGSTNIHILTQEIKIYLETNQCKEFLQINILKLSGKVEFNQDFLDCEGSIKKIEIIDLISLKQPHILVGYQSVLDRQKGKSKVNGLTIFSNKQLQQFENADSNLSLQMVEFKYVNLAKNNPKIENYVNTDIQLVVRDCFIDYLHATIIKLTTNFSEPQQMEKQSNSKTKLDQFEQDQDLEVIAQKILSPMFQQINIILQNPKIFVKPPNQQDQSFELQMKQISFELKSNKEQNRIVSNPLKISKKQAQVVQNLESIWCQTIIISADTMKILINTPNDSMPISNHFSAVVRLQQPLFINEYETLFPNITLDRNKDLRCKVTRIELNLLRTNLAFLVDVFSKQLLRKSQNAQNQVQNKEQHQQSGEHATEMSCIFQLDTLGIKIMEINNDFAYYGTIKIPLVDFQMELTNIMYASKLNGNQNIQMSVKEFRSHYYQYQKQQDLVTVKIQGIINSLELRKEKLGAFLDVLYDQPKDQHDLMDIDFICEQLKMQYYQNENQGKKQKQLSIELDIDIHQNSNVQISFLESKILINGYYFQVIVDFFTVPLMKKKKKQEIIEKGKEQSPQNSNNHSLINLQFNLNRSVIIIQEENSKDLITLQCELAAELNQHFDETYHQAYHQLNKDLEYVEHYSKSQVLKLGITQLQIYSVNFDKMISLDLSHPKSLQILKKKLILRPTTLEVVSHKFECDCHSEYQTVITEDTIKFDKVRINISYNDIAKLADTMKYQQEQIKQSKHAFKEFEEESIDEDQIYQMPNRTQMQTQYLDVSKKYDKSISSSNYLQSSKFVKLQSTVNQLQMMRLMKSKSTYNNNDDGEIIFNDDGLEYIESESEVQSFKQQKSFSTKPIKPIHYFSRRQLMLDSFEIVIINDLNKSNVPLILFPLQLNSFIMEDNMNSLLILGTINVGLMYFNTMASKMEPIIETTDFDLQLTQNREGYPKLQIMLEKKEEPSLLFQNASLNVNLSTQMILTLYKTLSLWSQKYEERVLSNNIDTNEKKQFNHQLSRMDQRRVSKLQQSLMNALGSQKNLGQALINNKIEQENQDNVTLFTIVNKTGFYIKVNRIIDTHQKLNNNLDIINNESKNYVILSDDQDFAKTFDQDIKISLRFNDSKHKQYFIENIPIQSSVAKLLPWVHEKQVQKQYFICTTNIENLQKTIHFLSPYMMMNDTDCIIQIKLESKTMHKIFNLEPSSDCAIPLEFFTEDPVLTLSFQDKTYQRSTPNSEPILLSEITKTKCSQIQHGINYTYCILDQSLVQGVTYIKFRPALIIYNLLPISIKFRFHSQFNKELQSQLIYQYSPSLVKGEKRNSFNPTDNLPFKLEKNNSLNPTIQVFENQQSQSDNNLKNSINLMEQIEEPLISIGRDNMIQLVPQGQLQIHNLQRNEALNGEIYIDGFSCSDNFVISHNYRNTDNLMNIINLKDEYTNNEKSQQMHIFIDRDFGMYEKQVYFYIKNCIINTTPYELKYFTLEDQKVIPLPGQTNQNGNVQISNTIKYFMIGMGRDQLATSNEVNVSLLGSVGLQLKLKSDNKYILHEFGIHISIANNSIRKGIYTKVIEIMPRYVVINNSQFHLNICQSGCDDESTQLLPDERVPLVWSDCRQEKAIRIQYSDRKGKYSWSGDIFISEIKSAHFFSAPIQLEQDSIHQIKFNDYSFDTSKSKVLEPSGIYKKFQIKKYDPDLLQRHKIDQTPQSTSILHSSAEYFREAIFLNAEITRNKATNYISIESIIEQNYSYKMHNKCINFNIVYQQDSFQSQQQWLLNCDQVSPFAWEFPSQTQRLKIKFNLIKQQNQTIHTEIVDLQQHQSSKEINIIFQNQVYIIWIQSEFQAETRLITLLEVNQEYKTITQSQRKPEQEPGMEIDKLINIYIASFGISLIMRKSGHILEANYIYLKQIEFGILQTPQNTTAQLRVKFINIDNNTSVKTTTPILLTLQRCQQALKDPDYYFLDASLNLDHNVKAISLYNFIRLSIKPFICQVDEEYISVVIETVKYINSTLEQNSEDNLEFNGMLHSIKSLAFSRPEKRKHYLQLMNELDQLNPQLIWNSIEINHSKKLNYIKELHLSTLNITFSFHKRFNNNELINQEENIFNLFSTAIGTTFQNINEASIILQSFQMKSIYDSQDIISQSIQDHYKTEIIKALLKIIGSIEIIGNPVRLIQQITNGLTDFVEMPIEGLKHGPLQFGVGIFKGTGSLLKNTVAGAFYSVNKVTGSISASISLLSMDDEFLENRRISMLKRPNHIIDGLSQAGRSLYNGFSEGISGVVMQPYREGQRDGFKGFVKGTFRGLSGLVVKPIAGVLDASAKAAEGVVNTATHFDDKPNDVRIRNWRVFYERQKYFTQYSEKDSRIMNLLETFQQGRFKNIDYKECYEEEYSDQQLVIVQKRVLQATNQLHKCFSNCSKVLILSYQAIFIIDGLTMSLVQEINPKEIEKVEQDNQGIVIKRGNEQIRLSIKIDQQSQVIESIKYLMEQVKNDY